MPHYTVYKTSSPAGRSRLWLRVVRWVGVALVVCVAAIAGSWFGWLQKTVAQVESNDPQTVKEVRPELAPPLPGEAMNILVLGSDTRYRAGNDPGRSDTLMLLRLDPKSKTISVLSVPRDLRVSIPGHGADRINTAYTYGGPALSIKTFKATTGLPINHYMEVDFVGFCDIVDALGGVYLDVDRRYYNPENTGWSAIDIKAGYQRLNGHDALAFCRFRHDATGDFMRMVRQQTFIRELKRQSFRWGNWKKVPKVIQIISRHTTSDLSSLKQLLPVARLILEVDTSKVYTTHMTAQGIMVGAASELEASPEQISVAVEQFTHPDKAPVRPPEGKKMPKNSFQVYVSNAGAGAGMAGRVAKQLGGQGYHPVVAGDVAPSASYTGTRVVASKSFVGNAQAIAKAMAPARAVVVSRERGMVEGVSVYVGASYSGRLASGAGGGHGVGGGGMLTTMRRDLPQWRQLAGHTPVKVEMPTVWPVGSQYVWSDSRSYRIPTGSGDSAAVCVVGETALGAYWHIEETRWLDPPAITSPTEVQTVGGTEYKIFYNGSHIHMVAFQKGNTLYWVANSLDEALSNDVMLKMAQSFKPVK